MIQVNNLQVFKIKINKVIIKIILINKRIINNKINNNNKNNKILIILIKKFYTNQIKNMILINNMAINLAMKLLAKIFEKNKLK